MKKKISIVVLLILVAVLAVGCTYNENLLKGYDFDYDDTTALEKDWKLVSGDSSSTVFSVSDDTLNISTSSVGWAYAAQELELKSNAYYKITYTYSISSINFYDDLTSLGCGCYVGFLEDNDFNIGAGDTGVVRSITHLAKTSGSVTQEFYIKTDYIAKATLALYVGNKDNPVNANVKVNDISIERVKKSAVESVVNPDTQENELKFFTLESDVYGANTEQNIVYIVLGGVFTLLLGYAIYILMQRAMAKNDFLKNKFAIKLRDGKILALLITLSVAFVIRAIIAVVQTALAGTSTTFYMGYEVEASAAQALFIGNFGPVYLKTTLEEFCTKYNYSYAAIASQPIQLYVLGIIGLMSKASSTPLLVATFLVKLLGILADLGTVAIIYLLIEKRSGKIFASLMGCVYALLPAVFTMSTGWGAMESVTAFLIALTMYFVLKNNYWGAVGVYFVAFTFSNSAILLLPIMLFYMINQIVVKHKMWVPVVISLVAGFALFYLVTLPYNFLEIKDGKAFACVVDYYNAVIKNNNYYAMNAFNFQGLLKNNFAAVSTESTFITILFDVFVFALVAVGYFKNKNRLELTLLGALLIVMLFTFTNKMTPVSMFVALALMLIYSGMNKEKRVFFCAIMFAALLFVNAGYIYLLKGYTTSGWEHYAYENNAMPYVFGAFNLIAALYFIYVVYDIVAARKVAKIKPMEVTYLVWIKTTGYRIKAGFDKFKAYMKAPATK